MEAQLNGRKRTRSGGPKSTISEQVDRQKESVRLF